MFNPLAKIRKVIATYTPGTALNIAQQKRRMEKDLQKQGLSRTHAQGIVAERFRNKLSK